MYRTMTLPTLLLVAAAALTACTGPAPTYLAVLPEPPEAVVAVGWEGVLGLSDKGCWGSGDADIVFPAGTTIQADGSGLLLADGSEIEVGDAISGAGLFLEQYTGPVPDQCRTEDVIVLDLARN